MHHLLYHANCCDGFASACLAYHALTLRGIASSYIMMHPVTYEKPMPINRAQMWKDDILYFLDFTPPESWISDMTNHPRLIDPESCIIIDHHKSARSLHEAHGDRIFTSVFDLGHSGAALTFNFWFETLKKYQVSLQQTIPLLRHYDLGFVWNDPNNPMTPNARFLVAYLMRALPRTVEAWLPVLLDFFQPRTSHVLDLGARLWSADLRFIRALTKSPHWVNIGGFEVPALNGIPYGLLNDALHELLNEHPQAAFAAAWTVLSDPDTDGVIKWSLRGRIDGLDLADLCASIDPPRPGKSGGGGHPQAAGFSSSDPVLFV